MLPPRLTEQIPPINHGLKGYYSYNIEQLERALVHTPPQMMREIGRLRTLELFRAMADRVPAYKDFLKKNHVDPSKITKYEDLQYVPWVDKKNYVRQYPLNALCWDGVIDASIISSSSGSSGEPTFWPRSMSIEMETAYIFELFFKNVFEVHKYRTIFISAFAMGVWVGGTFTLNSCMRISQKGYPLTIITPGVNKKEFIESVEELTPYFDQVILGGYPPLVKDLIDECENHGIDFKGKRVKLFFAAESISEQFRKFMYEKIGASQKDYYQQSLNLYGTADAAVAGHETPLSIFIRRLFSDDQAKTEQYFGQNIVPSINAFYPFFKNFDTSYGELLLSAWNNGIPLCRYNIHDHGNVIEYEEMIELAHSFGHDEQSLKEMIGEQFLWKLPYVYLHGKTDNSVKLSGAIIYPEPIKEALCCKELSPFFTGKFTMSIEYDEQKDQFLELLLELKHGVEKEVVPTSLLEKMVLASLLEKNDEFRCIYNGDRRRNTPRVKLLEYEDPLYFSPAVKQRWVKKA